jgi:hypothetical protein
MGIARQQGEERAVATTLAVTVFLYAPEHHPMVNRKQARIQSGDERSRPATGRLPSLGRIVPTEAKPSELSGEILWVHQRGVKAKSGTI